MSMAHSVEVRPPFLDHRIVEFAASLPPEMKMKGRRQKIILKRLMSRRLPPHILGQKKIGFDIPAHEWLRGSLRPLLLETIEWAKLELRDLFQPAELDRLVTQHLERRANLGYHLWGLMILFLWMKRWRIQTGTALPLNHRETKEVPVPI
jgi:asparagine synthase (glutamine-hydrolysing)